MEIVWQWFASMGPHSRDRGNQMAQKSFDEMLRASMGPRSRDRGNDFEQAIVRLIGFRFNGAAIT